MSGSGGSFFSVDQVTSRLTLFGRWKGVCPATVPRAAWMGTIDLGSQKCCLISEGKPLLEQSPQLNYGALSFPWWALCEGRRGSQQMAGKG